MDKHIEIKKLYGEDITILEGDDRVEIGHTIDTTGLYSSICYEFKTEHGVYQHDNYDVFNYIPNEEWLK